MSDEWSYQDVPIHKFNVLTEPNLVTGEIKQITDIAGKISEEIIQTKSDQIRNALIDLGWTPPEGKEHVPESKLHKSIRDDWLQKACQTRFHGVFLTDMPLHDLLAVAAMLVSDILKYERSSTP